MKTDIKIGWQDIYDAYRKLKSYVYFDSTSLYLREKIAKFEATHFYRSIDAAKKDEKKEKDDDFITLFKNAFRELYGLLQDDTLINGTENHLYENLPVYFNKWLEEIECIPIPKKVELDVGYGDNVHFITNYTPADRIRILRYNCLIDAPIEIHVLSVLWILKIGVHLTDFISSDNYAYLLNTRPISKKSIADKSVDDEHSCKSNVEVLPGLSLFRPYFIGYKNWRDRGLTKAMNELDENKPVVILSLDITRYYYNVRTNVLNEVIQVLPNLSSLDRSLCRLLQKVHEAYAKKLKAYPDLYSEENINTSNFPLPIGMLSSGILANLYLKDFDNYIKEHITPAYYGRYVDDILMVFAGKTIDFKEVRHKNKYKSPVDWFIRTHLIEKKTAGYSEEDNNLGDDNDFGVMKMGFSPSLKDDKTDNKLVYLIKTRNRDLEIQPEKVIMEYFKPEESRAAINKFRKKLEESSSEFRLLPFEMKVDEEFDNEAFRLEYNDSINKLRSIQSINEDKFGASKFLAQKIFLSILPYTPDEKENSYRKKSGDQILAFFKARNSIAMNNLWEKVGTYFLVNGDMQKFVKFYNQTLGAIDRIEFKMDSDDSSCDGGNKTFSCELTNKLKDSAKQFLILGMSMALALDPAKIDTLKGRIVKRDIENFSKYATNFRVSYMFRHQYQYIKGLCYTYDNLDNKISLLGRDFMTSRIGELDKKRASFLSPIFLKMEDIAILSLLNHLSNDASNSNNNP